MPASPPAAVSDIPGVAGLEAHRRPTKVYSVDRESRYSGVGQSKQTESSQATHFRKLLRGGRSCAAPLGVTEDSQAAPGGGAPEASNSSSIHFEDPSALPFKLPAGVDDVDAKWMQDLLHFRGTLPPDVNVSSIDRQEGRWHDRQQLLLNRARGADVQRRRRLRRPHLPNSKVMASV